MVENIENKERQVRLRQAYKELVSRGVADTQYELADKLGYTHSGFSQILNGKVPISKKFLKNFKSLENGINESINIDFIYTGEGTLFTPKISSPHDTKVENNSVEDNSTLTIINGEDSSKGCPNRVAELKKELIHTKEELEFYKKKYFELQENYVRLTHTVVK